MSKTKSQVKPKSKAKPKKKVQAKATALQVTLLETISEMGGSVEVDDLIVKTGRTRSSLNGLLDRLVDNKYLRKIKKTGEYALLKKARVELVAVETYERMDKLLKGMSVKQIEDLEDNSVVHITSLLLQAKTLPGKAIAQLSKVVEKHGAEAKQGDVGLAAWPNAPIPLYHAFKSDPESVDKREARIEAYAEVDLDSSNKDDFCKGRLFVLSKHAINGELNQLRYYGAFNFIGKEPALNFEGPALEKIRQMRLDGKGLNNRVIFLYGRLNYLKPYQQTVNPTVHIYDFEVAD